MSGELNREPEQESNEMKPIRPEIRKDKQMLFNKRTAPGALSEQERRFLLTPVGNYKPRLVDYADEEGRVFQKVSWEDYSKGILSSGTVNLETGEMEGTPIFGPDEVTPAEG